MSALPTDLRLGEPLGSGAVATVVRVHAGDGAVFAGKILHASHQLDDAAVQRFAQEAELLRGVSDPNLVEVHGLTLIDGRRVLLLELVEGPTLAQVIAREAPLGESRLAALGAGIARGLARAHAAGLVHRDLKPANILVAGGHTPKIGDFGMARATSLAGVDRAALTVLGTPDYMAPECLDPLAVDVRSDLYALGCILHEMATGRPPYSGPTAFGVALAHRRDPIPVLPDSFSPGLRALVASLLAKSPGDRPQAASQVAASLEQLAAGGRRAALAARGRGRGLCVLRLRPAAARGPRRVPALRAAGAAGRARALHGAGDRAGRAGRPARRGAARAPAPVDRRQPRPRDHAGPARGEAAARALHAAPAGLRGERAGDLRRALGARAHGRGGPGRPAALGVDAQEDADADGPAAC